jgi:type II secretory pathway pseudopilin PulG
MQIKNLNKITTSVIASDRRERGNPFLKRLLRRFAALKSASRNDMAFSLLEVLLASIIFIISIGGIFVTLNAVRKPVADKETALAAAVFGKQVLEAIRSSVNAGSYYSPDATCLGSGNNITCTDFTLALGTHNVSSLPSGLNCPPGFAAVNTCTSVPSGCLVYKVTCGDGSTPTNTNPPDCNPLGTNNDIARQVNLSINWLEAS